MNHSYKIKQVSFPPTAQSGAAAIELALIVPIVAAIIFACIEFARVFHSYQMATPLSRETALISFRECDKTAESLLCLESITSRMEMFHSRALPGVNIVVSLWRWNDTTSPPSCDLITQSGGSSASHISSPPTNALCRDMGTVNLADVFFEHYPVVPDLPSIIEFPRVTVHAISML